MNAMLGWWRNPRRGGRATSPRAQTTATTIIRFPPITRMEAGEESRWYAPRNDQGAGADGSGRAANVYQPTKEGIGRSTYCTNHPLTTISRWGRYVSCRGQTPRIIIKASTNTPCDYVNIMLASHPSDDRPLYPIKTLYEIIIISPAEYTEWGVVAASSPDGRAYRDKVQTVDPLLGITNNWRFWMIIISKRVCCE